MPNCYFPGLPRERPVHISRRGRVLCQPSAKADYVVVDESKKGSATCGTCMFVLAMEKCPPVPVEPATLWERLIKKD